MNAVKRALVVTCAVALTSFALAGTAFAATVHGADFHGSGSTVETGEIDVLNVDGSAGETIFLTVNNNGAVMAKNLPYTIGENAAEGDGSTWAGVVTLDIADLNVDALDGTYTIEAYDKRAGGTALYSGAIYGVYADLPDGTAKLIGTRTANADEITGRTFDPPETLFIGGRTYRLADATSSGASGSLHFAYEEYDESMSIDGVIKFTDATGAVIASTKIPGLAYGEQRTVDIPAVVTAGNGTMYRTVFFKDAVTAVNPGQTSFNIYCAQMTEEDALASYYLATIQMVDENGTVIASDSVNVTGEFIYTAPAVIYKTVTADQATGETAVVTYNVEGSNTIRLSAANDGVLNHERTVTVHYTAQPLDASEVSVTFNLLDGSKRVSDKDRVLGTQQLVATEDNPTVVPVSTLDVNGVAYHLAGAPSDYAYTLHSGVAPTVDVFYVPEGYEAPGAYNVTVNYVNFLTGAVIESHSYTSDEGANARIVIDSPEQFGADGVSYVRLAGQESAIQHSYYSGIASYTVYYRDINDTLTSGTVINTIRVVYADGTAAGGTATGADGVTITAGAAGAAGADDGTTALQLNAGRTYNVLDGTDNNSSLRNEAGVDSNTERIEDNETPLASGFDKGASSSAASSLSQMSSLIVPIAVGVAAVIAIAVAVVVLRRRKGEDADPYEL